MTRCVQRIRENWSEGGEGGEREQKQANHRPNFISTAVYDFFVHVNLLLRAMQALRTLLQKFSMVKNKDMTLNTSRFRTVSKRKKAEGIERITDIFQGSNFYEEGIKIL